MEYASAYTRNFIILNARIFIVPFWGRVGRSPVERGLYIQNRIKVSLRVVRCAFIYDFALGANSVWTQYPKRGGENNEPKANNNLIYSFLRGQRGWSIFRRFEEDARRKGLGALLWDVKCIQMFCTRGHGDDSHVADENSIASKGTPAAWKSATRVVCVCVCLSEV